MSAWTTIALCVVTVALLTAAVTSIRSVSRIWLRHWVELRLKATATAELLVERPHRLLLAGAAATAAATMVAGGAVASVGASDARLAALAGLSAVGALWVGGYLVPRALARRWPTVLVPPLLPLVRGVDALIGPLMVSLQRAPAEGEQTVLGDPANQTRDALHELLEEGVIEGVGEPTEIAIITGVVRFAEKRVREAMTPRSAIFAIDASLPRAEVARRIAAAGYSRVPVFDGTLDTIVGVFHSFDLLKRGTHTVLPLRPVAFTADDRACNELLGEMLRRRHHLVIVRDSSGRTTGLVTLEDLLEQLVGEIRDEHDEPAPPRGGPG